MTGRKDHTSQIKSIFCHKRAIQDHKLSYKQCKATQYHNRPYKTTICLSRPRCPLKHDFVTLNSRFSFQFDAIFIANICCSLWNIFVCCLWNKFFSQTFFELDSTPTTRKKITTTKLLFWTFEQSSRSKIDIVVIFLIFIFKYVNFIEWGSVGSVDWILRICWNFNKMVMVVFGKIW